MSSQLPQQGEIWEAISPTTKIPHVLVANTETEPPINGHSYTYITYYRISISPNGSQDLSINPQKMHLETFLTTYELTQIPRNSRQSQHIRNANNIGIGTGNHNNHRGGRPTKLQQAQRTAQQTTNTNEPITVTLTKSDITKIAHETAQLTIKYLIELGKTTQS